MRRVVGLRINHAETRVRLWIIGTNCECAFKSFAGIVPLLEPAIGAAEIFERDNVIGTELQRLIKVSDCLLGVSFAGGNKAEIVPRIRQRIGKAGMEFRGAFETVARLCYLLLIQIDAAQAVQGLRAFRIVNESALKDGSGLIVVSALKENGAIGEIVAAELGRFGDAGKRQRFSQTIGEGLRNMAEVFFEMVRLDWTLIDLDNVAHPVDEEGCRQRDVAVAVEQLAE